MKKENRFILFLICVVLFLIIAPYIILYSIGYRVDFEKMKLTVIGGIYIRVFPEGANVIVDSKTNVKTGLFSNSVFVQNLFPKEHTVLIQKDGYYDYQKNLLVKENEVTKLENVILFKKKISFDSLGENINYFSMAPDNNTILLVKGTTPGQLNFQLINLTNQQKQELYLTIQNYKSLDETWSEDSNKILLNIESSTGKKSLHSYFLLEPFSQVPKITNLSFLANTKDISFNPQNSDEIFFIKNNSLYSNKQVLPVINNVVTYKITNQTINWMGQDGFLYNSDILGKTKIEISQDTFPVKKNSQYKIISFPGIIFLKEDQSLFLLNQKSKIFESFYSPINDVKISPNDQKILYYNDNEIWYYDLSSVNKEKVLVNKYPGKIADCYWLNDDYLIFTLGDKIIISETDVRDTVNTVTLPPKTTLYSGEEIDIKKPKIFLNKSDQKLYFLTQDNLLISEKLTP